MSRRVRNAAPVVATADAARTPEGIARVLQAAQASAQDQSRRLKDVALLDGVLMEAAITTSAQAFSHKLGRKPVGWFVVDIDAAATVRRTEPFDPKTLTLRGSAAANVKVWVF